MDVILSLNHQCNLRCTYCYGGDKFSLPMPMATALKAIDRGLEASRETFRLLFFGGEPLLEIELIDEIATAARKRAAEQGKKVRFSLTCNGTLLDKERLDILEKHAIYTAVSIDGDQSAHDCARVYPNGEGSWQDVVKGLKLAIARLPSVAVIAVVHPDNFERMASSFDFLSGLGTKRINFNLDYSAAWEESHLPKLEAAFEALADRAIERYRRGEDFSVQPLHGKVVSHLKGGYAASDKCKFGRGEVAVSPAGRLYPCDRLIGADGPEQDHLVIGDIDSWIDPERVAKLTVAKDKPHGDCDGCAIIDRCMWWCGCVNHALTGQVDQVDGLLCQVEQIAVRAADRMAETLYAEENPTFMGRYYLAVTQRSKKLHPLVDMAKLKA